MECIPWIYHTTGSQRHYHKISQMHQIFLIFFPTFSFSQVFSSFASQAPSVLCETIHTLSPLVPSIFPIVSLLAIPMCSYLSPSRFDRVESVSGIDKFHSKVGEQDSVFLHKGNCNTQYWQYWPSLEPTCFSFVWPNDMWNVECPAGRTSL